MRDDPLPLASLAAELLRKASQLPADEELADILGDLQKVLPLLRMDEPHLGQTRRPMTREERAAVQRS